MRVQSVLPPFFHLTHPAFPIFMFGAREVCYRRNYNNKINFHEMPQQTQVAEGEKIVIYKSDK